MKRATFLPVARAELMPTPIAMASDAAIWKHAVTPMVRALLGPIGKGFTRHCETTEGLFSGDETSNLNGWSKAGDQGESKSVRLPYQATYYRTGNGAFIVKRDAVKIKAFGWYGDVLSGKPGELIFSFGLRDRRYDGTPRANDTALLDYPYDEPQNIPLLIDGKQLSGTSLETSLYSYLPGTGIAKACGDEVLEDFIARPFTYLDRPEEFLRLLFVAWNTGRYPGQVAVPIYDVGKQAHAAFEAVAKLCRYDFLETAPSHLHVYGWNGAKGYVCSDSRLAARISDFQERAAALKARVNLSRLQESWLFVLQSLRPVELIPEPYYLGGPTWPQNNIDQNNLWLYKPLSEKAKQQVAFLKASA